ncbi:hypothetical protein BV22DRAFT_1011620 [Leucogyrophana mollusca]|uniref:Uncharacterized protein n=1 Tax=Leucogyrophana mollusca TaxID=85980 RepID=A0ACB8BHA9_9AGAM|nr:hypothetical protein BV22DRAFT_1011620 [Leucogyrophana mollusca]
MTTTIASASIASSAVGTHRLFFIQELLVKIFQYIVAINSDGFVGLDRATLARLARSCRVFHEPAIEIMYEEVRNLHWLIKCMPRDLWEESETRLVFLRPMNQGDWNVFQRYARHVKALYMSVYHASPIEFNVYAQLGGISLFDVTFPRLRTLQCNESSDVVAPFLRHLLRSPLTSVTLMVSDGGRTLTDVLPDLRPLRQTLKSLGLSGAKWPTPQVTNAICEIIHHFRDLTSLRCDEITEDAAMHIAQMPALQSVHFTMPEKLSLDIVKSQLGGNAFLALQWLHIHSTTLEACLRVQDLTTSSHLRGITFTVNDETPAREWKEIFSSLASTKSYRNLSSFDITELSFAGKEYSSDHILDLAMLSPLLQFQYLTRLKLETFCTFKLDNSAVKQMAEAWPRLQSLDLSYREDGWELETGITLPGIVPLLRNCPDLHHLGLVIDARIVSANPSRLPGEGVRNMSLTTLWLADSPITRPDLVAAFLSSVAPNIDNMLAWDTEPLATREGARKYKARWKRVKRLIPVFAMTRKQERDRVVGGEEDDGAKGWQSESDSDPEPDEDDMDVDSESMSIEA